MASSSRWNARTRSNPRSSHRCCRSCSRPHHSCARSAAGSDYAQAAPGGRHAEGRLDRLLLQTLQQLNAGGLILERELEASGILRRIRLLDQGSDEPYGRTDGEKLRALLHFHIMGGPRPELKGCREAAGLEGILDRDGVLAWRAIDEEIRAVCQRADLLAIDLDLGPDAAED